MNHRFWDFCLLQEAGLRAVSCPAFSWGPRGLLQMVSLVETVHSLSSSSSWAVVVTVAGVSTWTKLGAMPTTTAPKMFTMVEEEIT